MTVNSTSQAIEVLSAICDAIEQRRDHLCQLDAALGDGDHGISMAKSFSAVRSKLREFPSDDLGLILDSVGMVLISEVGGAMGPLFGTAFMRAGKVVKGKQTIASEDLVSMLEAAEQGIVARGRAQLGDKTMLDAVHAATEAARRAYEDGADLHGTLAAAAAGAAEGATATKEMVARVGRASRLGERTLGHQDPGATSVAIILAAAAQMPYQRDLTAAP